MGGGGGGQAPQAAPVFSDPVNGYSFSSAEDLNNEIRDRKAQEDQASAAATAKAAQDKADADAKAKADDEKAENDFQSRFSAAKGTARDNIAQYFTQQGYDPNKYAAQIDNLITQEAGLVAPRAATPMASFDPSAGADLVTQLLGGARNQASSKINNAFSPTYADTAVSDSWLDPAIAPLLQTQFDPLSAQLQNAQKRGVINDQGYQAALQALSDKQTAARSTVSKLGQGILSTDRTGVNNYITGAKNDAAKVDLNNADTFSADPYIKGAGSLVDNYHNSFAGDLSNAVGNTAFADIGSLLNAGGSVQGATDPNATGGAASGAAGTAGTISDSYLAQQALAQQKRGLGTGGGF